MKQFQEKGLTHGAAQQSHHAIDDSASKKQLMDFLWSHEEMQQQLVMDSSTQTSASLFCGKLANRQLLHAAEVSNSVFTCAMSIFGMMKYCFTHLTMYAEYIQAVLWSHNILLPTLSS